MFPLRGAREDCLKDNQTNAIERKKLLRLVSGADSRGLVKRIFYPVIFFDVLNANGSRSDYSPLKAGSPAPLHNPLVKAYTLSRSLNTCAPHLDHRGGDVRSHSEVSWLLTDPRACRVPPARTPRNKRHCNADSRTRGTSDANDACVCSPRELGSGVDGLNHAGYSEGWCRRRIFHRARMAGPTVSAARVSRAAALPSPRRNSAASLILLNASPPVCSVLTSGWYSLASRR